MPMTFASFLNFFCLAVDSIDDSLLNLLFNLQNATMIGYATARKNDFFLKKEEDDITEDEEDPAALTMDFKQVDWFRLLFKVFGHFLCVSFSLTPMNFLQALPLQADRTGRCATGWGNGTASFCTPPPHGTQVTKVYGHEGSHGLSTRGAN
jgi:hypothetical protein